MKYTLSDIKIAAYNAIHNGMKEPPDLTPRQHTLFLGLAYCYEYNKHHPESTEDCKRLAENYITLFWGDDI